MKILYLAHRIPYPPDKGDKIRSYHVLSHLSRLGDVDLLAHVDDPRDLRHRQILADCCRRVELFPIHPGISRLKAMLAVLRPGMPLSVAFMARRVVAARVRELLETEDYDLIVAFSSQVARYVPPGVRVPFIMDMVDVDSAKFDQYGRISRWPKSWIHRMEAKRLRAFERAIGDRASRVVLTTGREVSLYEASVSRSGNVSAIVNGVVLPDSVTPQAERKAPVALFLGQMDYPPNVDAVQFAARQIWPLVRAQRKDAIFRIVGRNPVAAVLALAGLPGVEVTGAVPDLKAHLDGAALSLVPLRIARGIQNKVLESLAFGLPVITTRSVLDTLHEDARDAITARDEPEALASAVVELLDDPALRQRLADKGRAFVRLRHDWADFDRSWDRLIEEVAGSGVALRGAGGGARARL